DTMAAKPTCLIVASAAPGGVCAQSFLHSFTLCSSVFNLQTATPGGRAVDFVGVDESCARWVQDFSVKPYASPAKLESIDGSRYHALCIPDCPGALTDLAHSGSLARILTHFTSQHKPVCAVGQGVAALCCAVEEQGWAFRGQYDSLSLSASVEDAVHVVLDRHLVTGQNRQSTVPAVNNLIMLCNGRYVQPSPVYVTVEMLCRLVQISLSLCLSLQEMKQLGLSHTHPSLSTSSPPSPSLFLSPPTAKL
ncbi:GALD1 protein, partial [Amia calva]|nr:GALD1 protein [Amia calva]